MLHVLYLHKHWAGQARGGGGGMLVKVMDVFPILLEVFQMSIGKGGDWGGNVSKDHGCISNIVGDFSNVHSECLV